MQTWISRFDYSWLAIESVLDQRLYYTVNWEKHKCKLEEVLCFHQCFHFFLAFVVPGCATFSFTISPPFPIPVFLSQSPPSIITVIVSRVGRRQWRQQGGDPACNWTTALCSANGNSQIYSVDVSPFFHFFFSFSVVVSPHSLWPFFLKGPLRSEQFQLFSWCVCVRAYVCACICVWVGLVGWGRIRLGIWQLLWSVKHKQEGASKWVALCVCVCACV